VNPLNRRDRDIDLREFRHLDDYLKVVFQTAHEDLDGTVGLLSDLCRAALQRDREPPERDRDGMDGIEWEAGADL
jgi:hypothetical protein